MYASHVHALYTSPWINYGCPDCTYILGMAIGLSGRLKVAHDESTAEAVPNYIVGAAIFALVFLPLSRQGLTPGLSAVPDTESAPRSYLEVLSPICQPRQK